MNIDAKKYRVSIGGQSYTFVSDEPEELIKEASMCVDSLVTHLQDKAPDIDNQRIIVLAALKIAVDLMQYQATHRREQARIDLLLERLNGFLAVLQ